MSAPAPFRVIIAGYGWWGQHMLRRLKDHSWIKVLGIIEPAEALHDKVREDGSEVLLTLEAALAREDADAIILTTPNTLHEEQVIACAKAGKHVFCEKPLSLTGDSAKRAVAACEAANVALGIGHERRFEPAMLALRDMLWRDDLGIVMHAEAAFSHDKLIGVPAGDWRTSKAVAPAGGMTGMGIHLSDMFISFFGEVETVQAMVGHRSLGWETGDTTAVQLGFRDGPTVQFSAVLHTPHFIRMHVFGTKKWVEVINDTHPDTPGGKVTMTVSETGKDAQVTVYEWEDTVITNLEAFGDAAQGRAPYPFSHREMIHNIEVLEAITQSAEDRRTVTL